MSPPLLFSFFLGGVDATCLGTLEDVLRPVFVGLRRAGHRVISYAQDFAPPPAINIVVEHENADLLGRLALRGAARTGLLCAEDVAGAIADDARVAALRQAAATADFVWTVEDSDALRGIVPSGRHATIEYGFDSELLSRRLVPETARRDAGLVVYGPKTAYRMALVDKLKAAGLTPFVVEPGHFPDYIAGDLLSRAGVVVVCRDDVAQRAPAAARMTRALCSGALVVTEAPVAGPCPLAGWVIASAADDIATRCKELLGRQNVAQLGLANLEAFRAATRMADGLGAALDVARTSAASGG